MTILLIVFLYQLTLINYYKILAVPTQPSHTVIMPALVENTRPVFVTPGVPRYIRIEPS